MTDVPTTALKLADEAPDPSALTTGASPTTVTLGPRLYRITTGGTAGSESVVLPMPDLPLGGFANDQFVGLRITFCLEVQTNPADIVTISAQSGNLSVAAPVGLGLPQSANVRLSYEGAAVSFVWVLDSWSIDTALTDFNFDFASIHGQYLGVGGQTDATGAGVELLLQGGIGTGTGNGGDLRITGGIATGSGTTGHVKVEQLPTADPHVLNALWNNSGVLTVSAG